MVAALSCEVFEKLSRIFNIPVGAEGENVEKCETSWSRLLLLKLSWHTIPLEKYVKIISECWSRKKSQKLIFHHEVKWRA